MSLHCKDEVIAAKSSDLSDQNDHAKGPISNPENQIKTVDLMGVRIVALTLEGQERLCLAQISNILLKGFSYNEIHNRRVALGITCVQCTPVQLEILRRAGAMPISSRRCGMITMREAERLCNSFLADNEPPLLPPDFSFEVEHRCAWGCKGNFFPSKYNSSRAKCIKCVYCGAYSSPNKFIFHCHKLPDSGYIQPDAANFNSWRRHLGLTNQDPDEHLYHAWEDVKAMFNGGCRKRQLGEISAFQVTTSTTKSSRMPVQAAKNVKFSSPQRMCKPSGHEQAPEADQPFSPMVGSSRPGMPASMDVSPIWFPPYHAGAYPYGFATARNFGFGFPPMTPYFWSQPPFPLPNQQPVVTESSIGKVSVPLPQSLQFTNGDQTEQNNTINGTVVDLSSGCRSGSSSTGSFKYRNNKAADTSSDHAKSKRNIVRKSVSLISTSWDTNSSTVGDQQSSEVSAVQTKEQLQLMLMNEIEARKKLEQDLTILKDVLMKEPTTIAAKEKLKDELHGKCDEPVG